MSKSIVSGLVFVQFLVLSTGCKSEDTASDLRVREIKSRVFGFVTDSLGAPIQAADVALLGARSYEATTDEYGYFAIEDVLIADAGLAFAGGGGEANGAATPGTQPVLARYQIQVTQDANEDGTPDAAVFRSIVDLEANVYRTGGAYYFDAAPVQIDAVLAPFASMAIRVLAGSPEDASVATPAAGVRLRVVPMGGSSLRYAFRAVDLQTDATGIARISVDAQVPAVDGYRLLAFPYDEDPEANDGFEYDTCFRNVDLSPFTGFTPNPAYPMALLTFDLRDALALNAPPAIAFAQPKDGDELPQGSSVDIYFTAPMDAQSLEATLTACRGSCGDANDGRLLLTVVERTEVSLSVRPTASLPTAGAPYRFELSGRSRDGLPVTATLTYSVHPTDLPSGPHPLLTLDLPMVDQGASAGYSFAVDHAGVFVFDTPSMAPDTYIGALYSLDARLFTPDGTVVGSVDSDLKVRFEPDPAVGAYTLLARDHLQNPAWTIVGEVGEVGTTPDTPYEMEVSVRLPESFDVWAEDGVQTPFAMGNAVEIVVVPTAGLSLEDPAIDLSRALVLKDGWGPSLLPSGFSNAAGMTTLYGGRRYDDAVTLAFSETLDGSLKPVLDPDPSLPGVTRKSGRFEIGHVSWAAGSRFSGLVVGLAPSSVDAGRAYVGDLVANGEAGPCFVTASVKTANGLRVSCGDQVIADSSLQLLGPIQGGASAERQLQDGAVEPGRRVLVDEQTSLPLDGRRALVLRENGVTENVRVVGTAALRDQVLVRLESRVVGGFGTAASLASDPAWVTTEAVEAGTWVRVALTSSAGLRAGDVLYLDGTDGEAIEVASIESETEILIDRISSDRAAGTVLRGDPRVILSVATVAGDMSLTVKDPNGIGGGLGIRAGDVLIVGGESATVNYASGSKIQLKNKLASAHALDTKVVLKSVSIPARGFAIDLVDTTGLRAGTTLHFAGTASDLVFEILQIVENLLVLDRSEGLAGLETNAFATVDASDPTALRPDDLLEAYARDTSKNGIRERSNAIHGDGLVD